MSRTSMAVAPSASSTARIKTGYTFVAVLTWSALILVLILSAIGAYGDAAEEPGLYGERGPGIGGGSYRVLDTLSYFTEWSNLVVAIVATMLALNPRRDTPLRRVLLLDALLMITVTGIVYQVLLAPSRNLEGWSLLTNPWQHIVVPIAMIATWLICGPRGWFTGRTVLASLALPLAWIIFMLLRGAIDHTYPYGFANLNAYPASAVATTLGGVLVFGLLVSLCYWGLDVILRRRQPR